MALSKGALSELLDALRAGGDLDVVREALALVLQALIDAEATQHIGGDRTSGPSSAPPTATALAPGCCRPRPAMSSCASQAAEGSSFPALLESAVLLCPGSGAATRVVGVRTSSTPGA